ncbi:MAG TPA: pyridoxal-phosphate dependent enzyme [Phycicoccus sp.]|nr:pyridoxal-phosphate dependent enzyme [Phycicoccus sp.]
MPIPFATIEAVAARLPLPPTPAWSYPVLDAFAGCEVVVKHENVQPTGAFKVRGGLTVAASLSDAERAAGVVTASTGNHAQSIAYAARRGGFRAVIVVPLSAPPGKVEAVRALGAQVVVHGATMTEAGGRARALAAEQGLRYVDPGNDPAVIAGHATAYLELLRQRPDLEAIYVPVGSGTGAAGACLVRDALAPGCRIVGVQSAAAPAAYASWRAGEVVDRPCETFASGLATATGFEVPQGVLRARLDDFVVVEDAAIEAAVRLMATHAHTLAEGAGAAALAGLLADEARPAVCAIVCTGGNAGEHEFGVLGRGVHGR